MVLEVEKDYFINMDKIQVIFWMEATESVPAHGVIMLQGGNTIVPTRAQFDVVRNAFVYLHKSYVYDDNMKKIQYVKRGG
jgi:hypothetical protein